MTTGYLERGALAGVVGGLAYGLFVALVANPFVAGLETFESGHGHAGEPAVSSLTTSLVSIGGGVLWGLLFGIVAFGIAYYFLEPVLPGDPVTRRLVLAGAGFLTVSGAPWLVLPPQPPGVEQSLASGARTAWYGGMMVAGAGVSVLAGVVYRRLAARRPAVRTAASLAPLCLLALPVVLTPANAVHGGVPAGLVVAFRWTVVFGQVVLWATLAGVHAWLADSTVQSAEAADFAVLND
ncbi:CbtA family protein [Halobacteria archaeon HArc-gm2]|nr:CbtA family protein [Halobacteria archaeon HArc-gm2]